MTDIGIVIVNWNTLPLLRRCLDTVIESVGVSTRIVMVDNGSSDGSADAIREAYPGVLTLSGHGNIGYPAGNNLGLKALGYGAAAVMSDTAPRYALLLNPDTELPHDALLEMTRFMDSHPEVGVAGPKLVLPNGQLDLACRRSMPTVEVSFWRLIGFSRLFPKSPIFARYNLTFLDEDETTEVDSVVGAFMMVRREAIGVVGLMDEAFFMYGEDLDWAKRIKEAGWKIMYYPEVTVLHIKRAASRKSKRAAFEFVRAFLIFYNKHYRDSTPVWQHILVLLGIGLWGGPRIWPELVAGRRPAKASG